MLPALGDHLTLQFVHLAGERDFFVGDLFFQRAQLGQRLLEIRLGRAGGRLKRLRLAKRLAKQYDQKENQSLSHHYASYLMVTGTGTNSADLRFS